MVHDGSKNCKYQDLQINEYLLLRAIDCSEGMCKKKSLATPTISVVTGLCSYHLKQKQQCRTNQRFGIGAWSQYGDKRFQLEEW